MIENTGEQLGYLFGYSKKPDLSRLSVIKKLNNRNYEISLGLNFNKPWKMHKNIKLNLS